VVRPADVHKRSWDCANLYSAGAPMSGALAPMPPSRGCPLSAAFMLLIGACLAPGCGGSVLMADLADGSVPDDATLRSDVHVPIGDASLGDAATSDRTLDGSEPCGRSGEPCCMGGLCDAPLACGSGICSCKDASDCPDDELCTVNHRCITTLAADQFLPNSIVVGPTVVYWTNAGRGSYGSVVSAPALGGTSQTLIAGRTAPASIVLDSASVYWVESSTALLRLSLGGALTTLATGSIQGIAIDGSYIYWPNGAPITGGMVLRMPKGGGAQTTLISGQPSPFSLAVDATNVYWSSGYDAVLTMPKNGGALATFASGQEGAFDIVLNNGTNVSWTTSAGDNIVTAPIGGGAPTTLAFGQNPSNSMMGVPAVDASFIYWTYAGSGVAGLSDGAVLRASLDGGAVATLAAGEDAPTAIAIDSTSAYWTTASRVRKVTPR
jgi:hypothetical protein